MTRSLKLPTKFSAGLGLSLIDRAVKESFAARCSLSELAEVEAYFEANGGMLCFYCRSPDPSRWDHLHAVTRGGDTVPGNLVPACGRCDDSKQHRDVEEWAAGSSQYRPAPNRLPEILRRIEAYRRHFPYTPREFDEKLTDEQRERYARFRHEIDALRAHLESAVLITATGGRGRVPG